MHDESMLSKLCRTFLVFEAGHSVRWKQDIPCVRSKTLRVFEAGHCLCQDMLRVRSKNIPCVRSKTLRVFEARHSVCSKQDISCVRRKTFLVFEAGHSVCCEHEISCVPITNNAHATFWWIQPIVPGFGRIVIRFAQILGRSAEFAKKWRAKFSNFEQLKNREDSSDFDNFLTKTIASTWSKFSNIFARLKKTLRRWNNLI